MYSITGKYNEQTYPELNRYTCDKCNKSYKHNRSLNSHKKYECGKEPQFVCDFDGCTFRTKKKSNLTAHICNIHSTTSLHI